MDQNFVVPKHLIETMQEVARATQPLADIQRQLSVILEPMQHFTKTIQHMHEILAPTLEEQRKLAEFAGRIREYKKSEKKVMMESGWWITPSLMSISANRISQAVNDYESGSKSAITNLFRSVYQKDNCKYLEEVVTSWRKNKYFAPWEKHLDDALQVHRNKKYTLSVPVLLLTAEGVATEFCKRKGIYKKRDRSRGGEKIKKAARQHYKETSHILLSSLDLLEGAIDSTIYQNTDLIKTKVRKNILNRHAILHGSKKNYGTIKLSLQAFMLLDVLSELK